MVKARESPKLAIGRLVEAHQNFKLGGDWVKPLNHKSFKFSDG
jgi:hypothetical protein